MGECNGFKHVLFYPEPWGDDPICAYFAIGFVQPPTSDTPEN